MVKIRLVLTDCDGVLTDNRCWYSASGEELKAFSFRDGMGVALLRRAGIDVGIVTGESSPIVARRAEKLRIEECHLGIDDKLACVTAIAARRGIAMSDIAYIGDDVNDLEVLRRVGLSACPADAMEQVARSVDLVCRMPGGAGAFRELCEEVLRAYETKRG